MGLGARHGNARQNIRHETVGAQKHAVRSDLWADFQEGQRVRTTDGISGVIAAVEDGPFPGAEHYIVTLDHDLGGGQYTASQLVALGPAQASEAHTADLDYPELGSILTDRPDIAKSASLYGRDAFLRTIARDTCETCGQVPTEDDSILGSIGCPSCGTTAPHHVTVKDNLIHLNGEPVDHGWGPEAHSIVLPNRQGPGFKAMLNNIMPGHRIYRGTGNTQLGAARAAVKEWAQGEGKTWHIMPTEDRKRLIQRRREEGYR